MLSEKNQSIITISHYEEGVEMKKPWRILVAGLLASLVIEILFPELEGMQKILLRSILWLQANDILKPEN